MDWYKARKFICEISGHSGLSFFDALKSESAGARDVESTFPEPLKQPVLRKIQFSTVSRIDNLVDQVYDEFKTDYFPKEQVIVTQAGERRGGIIREKAQFPERKDPDTGEVLREAFTRYLVKLSDSDEGDNVVDDVDVSRDRKVFTKQMLRSFIKNTVTREAWTGAPWLVKQSVAEYYQIDTNVPPHLQHSHKVAEKKEKKKAEQQDGMFGIWTSSKLPELKPATKGGRKSQQMTQEQVDQFQQAQWEEYARHQHLMQHDPVYAQQYHAQHSPQVAYHNGFPYPSSPHAHYPVHNGQPPNFPPPANMAPPRVPKQPPPPPTPVFKFPTEDMDCPPRENVTHRPLLKFVAKSQVSDEGNTDDVIPALYQQNIGALLETWNTLNVYCQELKLDSFTFDDFVEAMQWSSSEIECELLIEIHCAILKKLVNHEKDAGGAIQISLPDLPEPDDSEEEEEEEDSRATTPTPEPDVPARRTRSSLNKMALAEQEKENSKVESVSSEQNLHRAGELFSEEHSWIDMLRKRDFQDNNWQYIMVGLLHQLSGRPRLKAMCENILVHFAPLGLDPTKDTVVAQYYDSDINPRIEALQIICQLYLETKAVKQYLELMSSTMTEYRKKKIGHQRTRKEAIANLKRLHDERRILAPQEQSPSPVEELEELQDAEAIAEAEAEEIPDSDDESSRLMTTRSLRRGNDRAAERKRKRDEEAERRKKEQEEKANKGSKEYQKILKAIEKEREKIAAEEEQIEIIDDDLREADSHRTRCLGKDRFCNRYWWFERNAMPYGGLPDSSTAYAKYANGRLWVQGPDDMEREGYIDVSDEARTNYHRCFNITPAERKKKEEGPTNLSYATQWGFYDDPEDIDKLLEWLDPRGFRELKLKKELTMQRDVIAKYMNNRVKYVFPERAKEKEKSVNGNGTEEPESEDEQVIPATTRMSTRGKTHAAGIEDLEKAHRCLRWKSTHAVYLWGHRHVDPPPAPATKSKKTAAKSRNSGISAEVISAPTTRGTRASAGGRKSEEPATLTRQGRAVTRGSRYKD